MARLSSQNDDARQPLLPTQRRQNHQHNRRNGTAKPTTINNNDDGDNENDDPKPSGSRITTFLNTNVSAHRADIPLIITFFISGLIDAGAYNAYQCFTSMQTGNTVFLALGMSDLPISSPRLAWTKSLTSITAFLLGSITLSALHRKLGERKRWVLALSSLFQAITIGISALLVKLEKSSGSPVGGGKGEAGGSSLFNAAVAGGLPSDPGFPWVDLIPIALLSFQASGKVVASRMTNQTGLPVVVLTTLYNDLIADPQLFSFSLGLTGNLQRNRKLGGLLLYFVGAGVGGWAARSPIGFSGGLGVAALVQISVAIAWATWIGEKEEEGES